MSLAKETLLFLYSCLLGVGFGVIFDFFRALRLALKSNKIIVFIQDVVLFIIYSFLSFCFMIASTDGELRIFVLIGEIAGFLIYICTLSKLVMKLAKMLIKLIKWVLRVFYKVFIRPFVRLFKKILGVFTPLYKKISKKAKKSSKKPKNHLKKVKSLLYNKFNKLKNTGKLLDKKEDFSGGS